MSTSVRRRKGAPPQRQRRRWLRWLVLAFSLTGVAAMSATAGALLAVSMSSTPLLQSELTPEEQEVFNQEEGEIASNSTLRLPRLTRPVNVLILGVKVLSTDLDEPPLSAQNLGYHALVNSFEGLSDTMLLVRFDPATGEMTVLSIPRDTRTYVEGLGETKINSANYYGGPALSARAISELLGGTPIDRYVRINVQGVEKLIEALGGVTLNVPEDMQYQDDSQHLYINLKQGPQHLDGAEAMQFLRFRYDANGDVGRVQRQQMFMRALTEQTLSPRTIARLPQILSVIQSHVDTNLSVEELVALVGFGSKLDRETTQMVMLPGEFSAPGQYDLSYWLPDYQRIDAVVDQYLEDGYSRSAIASSPAYLDIAIQNSTGNLQAIDHVADQLDAGGYYNYTIADDWSEPLVTTQIIAQNGDVASAEMLQRYLGFGEVRVDSTGILRSDITLQLGRDWLEAGSGDPNQYLGQ